MKGFSKNYENDIKNLVRQINSEEELKNLFQQIHLKYIEKNKKKSFNESDII